MNCPEARKFLHAFADGELDVPHELEMAQHLKNCAACAAQLDSIKSLRSALKRDELYHRAPASLRRAIFPNAAPAPGNFSQTILAMMRDAWSWTGIAIAAVAVFLLTTKPVGISPHEALLDEVVSAHVRSLQAQHLMDVPSTDQHTVKPWFDGKLDFAPTVKDYAAQGFTLIGGRLDYLDHRPAAALVYQHNKHFINLFIQPQAEAKTPSTETEIRRGYSVVHYGAEGFSCFLISDTDPKTLEGFSQLLQQK